jgi:hypothetical protein
MLIVPMPRRYVIIVKRGNGNAYYGTEEYIYQEMLGEVDTGQASKNGRAKKKWSPTLIFYHKRQEA